MYRKPARNERNLFLEDILPRAQVAPEHELYREIKVHSEIAPPGARVFTVAKFCQRIGFRRVVEMEIGANLKPEFIVRTLTLSATTRAEHEHEPHNGLYGSAL